MEVEVVEAETGGKELGQAIPIVFLKEIEQTVLKSIWNHKLFWIVEAILREMKKNVHNVGIMHPELKLYTK